MNVDGVCANFEAVPLHIPPNDEVMTLEQAVGTFIQWPKEDICLELPALVSTGAICTEATCTRVTYTIVARARYIRCIYTSCPVNSHEVVL